MKFTDVIQMIKGWRGTHPWPHSTIRVGIVGSRQRTDEETVREAVRLLSLAATEAGVTLVVVTGGCRGPDRWAEDAARRLYCPVDVRLPARDKLPAQATRYEVTKCFYARNEEIARTSDVLIAFVGANRRGGTEYTIKCARKHDTPVVIMQPGVMPVRESQC